MHRTKICQKRFQRLNGPSKNIYKEVMKGAKNSFIFLIYEAILHDIGDMCHIAYVFVLHVQATDDMCHRQRGH